MATERACTNVMTRGGDVWDSYRTRAEAEAEVERIAREVACEGLRGAIAGRMVECEDPAVLAAVLAMLRN